MRRRPPRGARVNELVVLGFGLGVFVVYDALTRPLRARPARAGRLTARVRAFFATRIGSVALPRLAGQCAGARLGGGAAGAPLTGATGVALVAKIAGAYAPVVWHAARQRAQLRARQRSWPEALELLAGAARAGETLVGSLAVVGERGPEGLRTAFRGVV